MELTRRLNQSWQKLPRNRHLGAKELELNDAEYRLLDLCVALYDWDLTHEETYGTIKVTDRGIAEILGWSPAKVCRTRNKLIKKGLISKKAVIRESKYQLHSLSGPIVNRTISNKEEVARVQDSVSPLKPHVSPPFKRLASLQQNQGYSDNTPLVSYKNKYSLIKNEEEYQKVNSTADEQGKAIGDDWFSTDPEKQKLCEEHRTLAQSMLSYEIEHDLLPI